MPFPSPASTPHITGEGVGLEPGWQIEKPLTQLVMAMNWRWRTSHQEVASTSSPLNLGGLCDCFNRREMVRGTLASASLRPDHVPFHPLSPEPTPKVAQPPCWTDLVGDHCLPAPRCPSTPAGTLDARVKPLLPVPREQGEAVPAQHCPRGRVASMRTVAVLSH